MCSRKRGQREHSANVRCENGPFPLLFSPAGQQQPTLNLLCAFLNVLIFIAQNQIVQEVLLLLLAFHVHLDTENRVE